MKQPNAYNMVDQTTKQTMTLKTPLYIKSPIPKIKNMHHTYNNPILRPSNKTVNIQYGSSSHPAASLSELDHPAPQFHSKIQSYYPPFRYIQLVLP